jgi:Zn-dependent protease with chaperone function
MIFTLRGLAVSLAFSLLFYCVLSVGIVLGWKLPDRLSKRWITRHRSDLLFSLRILPLVATCVFTLLFVVPSFVLLEPRQSMEPVGEIPLLLGSLFLLLVAGGAFNALSTYTKTSHTVTRWLSGASLVSSRHSVPVYQIRPSFPALTLAGIREHKMLLSEAAASVLTPNEMDVALKHEIAHALRRDNLKKLVLRVCAFPGMAQLESGWADAEEMTADDDAVSSPSDALDLAAALIKLSRLATMHSEPLLTTSLVQQRRLVSINVRVERLMRWETIPRDRQSAPSTRQFVAGVVLGLILTIAPAYPLLLRSMHFLTEWMVR